MSDFAIGQTVALVPDVWGLTGVIVAAPFGAYDYGVRTDQHSQLHCETLGFNAHELRAVEQVAS